MFQKKKEKEKLMFHMLSFSPSTLDENFYRGLALSLAQSLGITALNPVMIYVGSTVSCPLG